MDGEAAELERFESGNIDPKTFGHAGHVRVAYTLLTTSPFVEALQRFAISARALAVRAGRPEAYNETITVAFLSLISERIRRSPDNDYARFAAANADLFDKDLLDCFYSRDRLHSLDARTTFLLPDRLPAAGGVVVSRTHTPSSVAG